MRAENPVHGSEQQVRPPGTRPVMIIDHVPAVCVPPDHAASRVAAAMEILKKAGIDSAPNQHRPHRSLRGDAPLKPLPEPAHLGQYRVRRQARVGGLINEYRLVA